MKLNPTNCQAVRKKEPPFSGGIPIYPPPPIPDPSSAGMHLAPTPPNQAVPYASCRHPPTAAVPVCILPPPPPSRRCQYASCPHPPAIPVVPVCILPFLPVALPWYCHCTAMALPQHCLSTASELSWHWHAWQCHGSAMAVPLWQCRGTALAHCSATAGNFINLASCVGLRICRLGSMQSQKDAAI